MTASRFAIGALLPLTATILFAASAPAAEEARAPASPPPRLGLVLSGGGARGAAHIGVIEVLEELRVPVDLVTGTSMGSIVGGLYAAGLSPEELSLAIQSIDWVKVFADKPDRQDLSFRRKQDDRNFLTNLRLAFKGGAIFIPSGLVEGQKLDYLLRTLTLTADGVAYIENLPLPFRAVATDIVTGEAVVFDHGPLALAQRASMSIPAAFSPVIVDERLLVDGYVANNLPIDVAQEMGAEAVIAVDISTPAATRREELQSAVAISGQSGTFPVQESQRRQIERMKPDDVLLRPELGDLSSASFTRMPEAIEAGRQAALAAKDVLSRYSVSEAEFAEWRARHRRPAVELPVVDEVRIENRSPLSDRVIRARIETRAGERLDLERLSDDLGRLYGTDAFERVRFDLRREQDRMVLIYQLDARQRGAHFFRFGLNLESDIGNESNFNIALNHVWLPINAWNGEMRNEGQLGDTNRVSSELYQPIDPGDRFFAMPFVQYEQTDLDFFQSHDRVARFDLEQTLSALFLGVNITKDAQLRGGIGYLDGDIRRKIGDPAIFKNRNFHGGLYALAFEYDTLDDTRFPNDGSYLDVEGLFVRKELGFRESFERVRGIGAIYRTYRRNTLGLAVRYSTSIGASSDEVLALHSLGGFLNLSGFERNSLVGRHAGFARAMVYRRIASPAVFAWEFPVYAGAMFEVGNAWDHRSDIDEDLLMSTGPFFGIDTPLGPLYLSYAYGEGGEHQGYLFLGQSF